jgi:hypothetical protein
VSALEPSFYLLVFKICSIKFNLYRCDEDDEDGAWGDFDSDDEDDDWRDEDLRVFHTSDAEDDRAEGRPGGRAWVGLSLRF